MEFSYIDKILLKKDTNIKNDLTRKDCGKIVILCRSRFDLQNMYTKLCLWTTETTTNEATTNEVFIYDDYYFGFYYDDTMKILHTKQNFILLTNTITDAISKIANKIVYL